MINAKQRRELENILENLKSLKGIEHDEVGELRDEIYRITDYVHGFYERLEKEMRVSINGMKQSFMQQISEVGLRLDDIEKIDKEMGEIRASMDSLGKSFMRQISEVGLRVDEGINRQKELGEAINRQRGEIISLMPDVEDHIQKHLPSIHKRINLTKEKLDQVIEEFRNEIKITYSKFGGGSQYRYPQWETPSGVVDGVNMVYTVKNDPLFIEVGGNINSTQNGGYSKSGSAPNITITFAFPPPAGQTPQSCYV